MQTFEKQFPSLKHLTVETTPLTEVSMARLVLKIQLHCLDKVRVQEALTKYSNLNNKTVKSFQSMEEAQELNDAWNTMIDELGI